MKTTVDQQRFIDAYIDCLIWADAPEESDGDLHPESVERARIECLAFLYRCWFYIGASKNTYEQAGHDFWLTRNGHGAGFWEKSDWPVYGDILDKIARSFGEVSVYEGDDGFLYTD